MKRITFFSPKLILQSLLSFLSVSVTQAAPVADWVFQARIANGVTWRGITDAELDAIVAARKAESVSVIELDPGFSEYLTDAEFAVTIDILRRITQKAHAEGIKTVVYITSLEVNTTDGENLPNSMFKDHPDWAQRGFNNEAMVFYGSQEVWVEPGIESVWLSPNSGYREYFYNRLKLIAASGTDGIWIDVPVYYGLYNESDGTESWGGNEAAAAPVFKQWSIDNGYTSTGYNLPTGIDWNNRAFKAWIVWRHENLAHFVEDARLAVKSVNPDILLIDEIFPVDNMDSTSTGIDKAFRINSDDQLTVWEIDSVSNVLGMKWSNKEDFANKITMYKFARGMDRENPSWAFSYGNEELDAGLVMGASVAAGVAPFEAKTPYMTTTVGAQFRNRWFGFVRDNDETLLNTPREARVGVLYSSPSRDFQDYAIGGGYGMFITTASPNNDPDWWGDNIWDTPLKKPHLGGYRGASYALSKLHIPHKIIVDPGDVAAQLEGVDFLWMPSVAAISNQTANVIKQFVRDGGVVLATGTKPGTMNEKGDTRTTSVFQTMFNLSTATTQTPRANIAFGNNNNGGVAIYRPNIKGTDLFPYHVGTQAANKNLEEVERFVRVHAEDYVLVDAPEEGVHLEVSRPSHTKHYMYVLNYSGFKLPLVSNLQTIGLQYHAPEGYKVVSATVKTPDSAGDSGVTSVSRTVKNWYGMNVKVDQFAIIEVTLQPETP